jgi:predicted RNA-binding Zn-ribbon protein involved in translation (DUF1610 family)
MLHIDRGGLDKRRMGLTFGPRYSGEAMARKPLREEAEVEMICPRCGYHLRRTAGRLRRDTPVVCPNCGEQVVPAPPAARA